MKFQYKTYKQYLEAYTYLIRVLEPFSYTRDINLIEVNTPDEEIITTLHGFM